jgi:hypothetical protein
MYCVQQVMVFAQGGNALGRIDFTENDEFIKFELDGRDLRAIPTYMGSELVCSAREFVAAGSDFIREELKRVVAQYPKIARNEHAYALAQEVGIEFPKS